MAKFFENIRRFAFFDELAAVYAAGGDDLEKRLARGDYADIVRKVLTTEGLGYGQLPKGLVSFHWYPDKVRKAAEEHLAEGVEYAVALRGKSACTLPFRPSTSRSSKLCCVPFRPKPNVRTM